MSDKKTVYERVVASAHGVDDTIRDTFVYPNSSDVLGISECDDALVLTYASKHDDGGHPQVVWINTDNIDAMEALQESVTRVLDRAKEKAWKKQEELDS